MDASNPVGSAAAQFTGSAPENILTTASVPMAVSTASSLALRTAMEYWYVMADTPLEMKPSDRRSQYEYQYDTARREYAICLRANGMTLRAIGARLGISREQARRLTLIAPADA